eukprot:11119783-Karenia_brevis.AAC.1
MHISIPCSRLRASYLVQRANQSNFSTCFCFFVNMPVRRRPAAAVGQPPAAAPGDGVAAPPEPGQEQEATQPTGPYEDGNARAGRARRQLVWWITFSFPYVSTVERLGLKTPDDMNTDGKQGRQTFLGMVRRAHVAAGIALVEAAVFLEKHARTDAAGRRLPHLNCLVRASAQYAWSRVAQELFNTDKVRVDFSANIKTWYDGVVYGH